MLGDTWGQPGEKQSIRAAGAASAVRRPADPMPGSGEIACAKLDDVSGDEIPHRNFTELPVTQHGSLDCNRAPQRLDSRLRPLFLKNIERDREQDDEDNHNEALPVTYRTGNQRGNEKNGN